MGEENIIVINESAAWKEREEKGVIITQRTVDVVRRRIAAILRRAELLRAEAEKSAS